MRCCKYCGDKVAIGTSLIVEKKEIGPYCRKPFCQDALKLEEQKQLLILIQKGTLCAFGQKSSGTHGMQGIIAERDGLCSKHLAAQCAGNVGCTTLVARECRSCHLPVCKDHPTCTNHPVARKAFGLSI
ncbi:hypothetical protein HY620_02815 [Candidatus Uhrbacteria bacterium]|nr:hypothetical protein [Candidatus Uhrbacteria bacterium]